MTKRKKRYSAMNTAELAEATKRYDENFIFEKGKSLSAAEKKRHATARKRAGRGSDWGLIKFVWRSSAACCVKPMPSLGPRD